MHPSAIGQFKIEHELGRGGMGEVYLAHDTRLDRQVAIKAMPAHLAQDPDRLARFQREAKVLASLNHPGIASIYGLEEANGLQYLILEFIDGETLAERLARGPLPVEEALTIAKQMAEALEVAHEKGIIHRDLKPGNVMVTADGVTKVLDFGLARTAEGAPSSTNLPASANSPTLTSPPRIAHSPTIPGAIMGTAGYMSPEQARGRPVDKRSDIFSFGCVLYEMLTGAMPFAGETAADSIGATLHKDSNLELLPPSVPARIRDLLSSCLAKDRKHRLHDIADARLQLELAIAGRDWAASAAPVQPRPRRAALVAGLAVLMLGAGALAGVMLTRPAPPPKPTPFHVSVATPPKPELSGLYGIAPDSRFVICRVLPDVGADPSKPEGSLIVRRLDREETKTIPGTEGAIEAALSSDGRWIAFTAGKDRARTRISVKKVAISNGQPEGMPELLCDLPGTGDATLCWSSDREIVVAQAWNQTILAIPASGGEPRVVLKGEASKGIETWGDIRPLVQGKSILASRWAIIGRTIKERTEIVDLATGARTPLLENAGAAQYLPSGHLVARRTANSLIAVPFDLSTQRVTGEPVTVLNSELRGTFFVAPSGTLVKLTQAGDISGRTLAWLDDKGRPEPLGAPARAYSWLAVSPDTGRVVTNLQPTDVNDFGGDLWVYDIARSAMRRLPTPEPAWRYVWSNDGQRIAYNAVSQNDFSIWERRADGSGEPDKLVSFPTTQLVFPIAWSPDGKTMAILKVDLTTNDSDVMMLAQDPTTAKWVAFPYLSGPASEGPLVFSPDGKWVRYVSSDTGRPELYMQRFSGAKAGAEDDRSGRIQLSTAGAQSAGWASPDGKEIRFFDSESQLVSIQVTTAPTPSASLPKPIFSLKELKSMMMCDFAPDGRLMAIMKSEEEGKNRIDLVVNFVDDMKAKLATGN